MPRVVQPRVDHDPAHGDTPRCWVCRQVWPHAFSLILDFHHRELRIDGQAPVQVKPSEADVLAVLINAFPRWITRAQLVEYAYAERPDVNMPGVSATGSALSKIRETLAGSRYVIETDTQRGVRLVTEELLERERREYVAQIPNTGLRAREAVKNVSLNVIEKLKRESGVKKKVRKRFDKIAPEGITQRTTAKGTPKISKRNVLKRKPAKTHV